MKHIITYHRSDIYLCKATKLIAYTTPSFRVGDHLWIIVVSKNRDRRTKQRKVYPMWRRFDDGDHGQSLAFDWNDMESWPHYNRNDRKNLGLPVALRLHYHNHCAEILKHQAHYTDAERIVVQPAPIVTKQAPRKTVGELLDTPADYISRLLQQAKQQQQFAK